MPPPLINLAQKLASLEESWVPKVAAELNGQYVKVAKFLGAYVWHQHEAEDEAFLVVSGRLRIEFRDGESRNSEGGSEPAESWNSQSTFCPSMPET